MQNHYLLPIEKMREPRKTKADIVIFQFTIIEEMTNDKNDNIRYYTAKGITLVAMSSNCAKVVSHFSATATMY